MKNAISTGAASAALIFFFCVLCASVAFGESPFSGFNPAVLTGKDNGVFVDTRTFWADNAVPLQSIFLDKGWDGPFKPADANHLDVFWKADTGVVYRGWRVAGFYRGELFLKCNKDTIEILRMIELKQNLPVGRTFNVDLKGKGFSATGIEASKGFKVLGSGERNNLSVGLTARYMRGERVQDGTVRGTVTPGTAKSYDFDLAVDYVYDKNYLYKRQDTVAGSGDGYSFDAGLKYDFSKALAFELLFRDILGRMYWHNTPFTTAEADSNTKFFDENGYMRFRPSIRGYEFYKNFTQNIPLKTDVSVTYRGGPFVLQPTVNFIEGRPLYWIDMGYKAARDLLLNAGYNFNYKSYSAGVVYKHAVLSVYADDFALSRAMAVGFKIALAYRW